LLFFIGALGQHVGGALASGDTNDELSAPTIANARGLEKEAVFASGGP